MADTDLLPKRGVPTLALVDSSGIASNGTKTVAQFAASGIRCVCAVDGTGVSPTGATAAVLASRGIRAFCPVDQLGVAANGATAEALDRAGIRPMVLTDANGIALNGSANMATLASRSLQAFCPVDESGNATTMGAVVLITNNTVLDNATIGTTVGVLSVSGGTGTYTFSLLSNPGGLFVTAGTNGVNLNTATTLTVGDQPITVRAAGGVPTPVDRTMNITVLARAPANTVLPAISGSTVVLSTLTATTGTWTGSATITFSYQWKRGGSINVGSNQNTYATVEADIGSTVTVTVTASNSAGFASATSVATAAITGIAPANAGGANAPVLSGTAADTQILSVTTGTWTGIPAPTFSYQWKRLPANTNIGTNSSAYTVVTADVGSTIRCDVTGTNSAGNATAQSNVTATVASVPVAPSGGTVAITGSTVVLQTLTATPSGWLGTPTITYSYQWKSGGVNVGTTANTYTTVAADVGSTITVTVTASNGIGSANATSSPTAAITGIAPANTAPPVIAGVYADTQTLNVSSTGTWTGTPAPTFSYQWKRNVTTNVGINSSSYTLVTADVGADITCVVTGTNVAGNASATSNILGPVGTLPVNTAGPSIGGSTVAGSVLTANPGVWTGSPTPTITYLWRRNGVSTGVTTVTYTTVNPGDVGATFTVVVTGTNVHAVVNAPSGPQGPMTAPPDTTPDAFTFIDMINVATSTVYESNTITVAGIDTASNLTITGGEYSINGGAYASAPTTVVVGNTVKVRGTSSPTNGVAVNITLTIGGVSDTFTITTFSTLTGTTMGLLLALTYS